MKTSCLRLKLVELNFFASFNADDQRKPTFLMFLNYDLLSINVCSKIGRNRFSNVINISLICNFLIKSKFT